MKFFNFLFVSKFMAKIHAENLIIFDISSRLWKCDLSKIQKICHSENVIDLLLIDLKKLPKETKEILKIAACIGFEFDIEIISKIIKKTPKEILINLSPAIFQGFIHHQNINTILFQFFHDRIHEAFYLIIKDDKKLQYHYNIGMTIKQLNQSKSWSSSDLFNICRHLNYSLSFIKDKNLLEELVELNIISSTTAQKGGDFKLALHYCNLSLQILFKIVGENGNIWVDFYNQTISIVRLIIENYYLIGDLENAQKQYHLLLENVTSVVDRISARSLFLSLFSTLGRYQDAMDEGIAILNELGVSLVDKGKPYSERLNYLISKIPTGEINYFKSLPLNTNDKILEYTQSTLSELYDVTFYIDAEIDIYSSLLITGALLR